MTTRAIRGITIRCTGAAGRAGAEINVVRRGPVNGSVTLNNFNACMSDWLQ